MLCAGAVRRKNVQNTMLKNLLDAVSLPLWKERMLPPTLHIDLKYDFFMWLSTVVRSISRILCGWICVRLRKQW